MAKIIEEHTSSWTASISWEIKATLDASEFSSWVTHCWSTFSCSWILSAISDPCGVPEQPLEDNRLIRILKQETWRIMHNWTQLASKKGCKKGACHIKNVRKMQVKENSSTIKSNYDLCSLNSGIGSQHNMLNFLSNFYNYFLG